MTLVFLSNREEGEEGEGVAQTQTEQLRHLRKSASFKKVIVLK